jgi:hypothetical protein
MRQTRITTKLTAAALLVAATPLVALADGPRIPFTASLQGGGRVILPVIPPPPGSDSAPTPNPEYWSDPDTDYATRCQGAPVLVTEAAGNASLLGLVTDFQSHCLGATDEGTPSFFNGRFRFTDPNGRFIEGEYFGTLKQTVASQPPPAPMAPPSGTWIIDGHICVSGASPHLHIGDDCAAKRYFPATGVTDPSTGVASIFINQTIGVRP